MTKILAFLLLTAAVFHLPVKAQYIGDAIIKDLENREPIYGAQIYNKAENRYAVSNEQGGFIYPINSWPAEITIASLGYETVTLKARSRGELPDTIYLVPEGASMGQIVITASRNRQRIEEVTQTMELVKPDLLKNTQTAEVQRIMEKLPGLVVQKDQVTIRGTSGFSYSAGSRVLVLLDEMPILSADAGDAKWSYYPIENLAQMEVMKGASSALYGASALEGVIHLQTAVAGDTPYTQIRFFEGVYDRNPKEGEPDNTTYKFGASLAHRRRAGPLSIVSSLTGILDQGYRELEQDAIIRGNLSLQYTPRKSNKWLLNGSLNGMMNDGYNFLLFGDVAHPYTPMAGTSSDFKNSRWHADLAGRYYPNKKDRHILRGRMFRTINSNNTNQSSTGQLIFSEYQFQTKQLDMVLSLFKKEFSALTTLTGGVNYILTSTWSEALYGTHMGRNAAAYLQADQKLGRLNLSLGGRLEYYSGAHDTLFPVYRAGANFRLLKGTFLRASAGQGIRYPSVAELYGQTTAGLLKIFPNDTLMPERGFSMEAGFRQVFATKRLKGYLDGSVFQGRYTRMIEYKFGNYAPPGTPPIQIINYFGFKPLNIDRTLIRGVEVSAGAQLSLGPKSSIGFMGGYTYVNPINEEYKDTSIIRERYLRYRRQHLVRANLEMKFSKLGIGLYALYNSPIRNMDLFFLDVIKGLKKDDYWIKYSEGFVADVRLSYAVSESMDASLFCQNILNEEYMEAPGNTNAPRQFVAQVVLQF